VILQQLRHAMTLSARKALFKVGCLIEHSLYIVFAQVADADDVAVAHITHVISLLLGLACGAMRRLGVVNATVASGVKKAFGDAKGLLQCW
jgi:hypothetical protein